MKTLLTTSLVILPLLSAGSANAAGDVNAGRARAAVCTACHGPKGISLSPQWPNLAGQKDLYLVKQLKAFRDGSRSDPLMSPQAKPLTDSDIENIAAYYSKMK